MISELYQHITNTDEHVTRELKHAIQYAMIVLTPIAIGTYTIKQYTPQTQDKVSINMAMEIIAILIAIITITFAADRIGTFFIPEGDYRIITILVLFLVLADSSLARNIKHIIQWGVGYSEGMTDIKESSKQPDPIQSAILPVDRNCDIEPRPVVTTDQVQINHAIKNEMETINYRESEPAPANEFNGGGSAW